MKYNNKLNLVEYIQVVEEITNEFFDANTYEFTPHIGEVYAVCAYFNHCVELEETDTIKKHPIEEMADMQELLDNEDFMKHFNEEINESENVINASLTFGHAYNHVLDIVEFKKNDANAFATAISAGMGAILNSFRESFSDDEISKFTNIAQQIVEGKISNQGIVDAYTNSDRFKEKTESIKSETPVVIPFPQKK